MKKQIDILDFRNAVRLLVVIFSMPWLGDITKFLFGYEVKFEVEVIITISYLIFGSFWCGWLCPFGNMSYFVSKIGEKLFPTLQIKIPEKYAKPLGYLKYVFLIMFIFAIYQTGHSYFFGDHGALYKSTPYTFFFLKSKKYLILLFPLFIPRVFCKFFCPQKALYNILNKIVPTVNIVRDDKKCIGCKKCDKVCPMSIEVSRKQSVNGSSDCISCYQCIHETGCPKKVDALSIKAFGKTLPVLKFASISLLIYIILTGITIYLNPSYLHI